MRLETPLDRKSISTGLIIEDITRVLSSLGIDEKNKIFQNAPGTSERNKKFQEIIQSIVKELFRRGYIFEAKLENGRIPIITKEKMKEHNVTLEDIAREVLKMEKREEPVEEVKDVKPAEEKVAREDVGKADLPTYPERSLDRQAGDLEKIRIAEEKAAREAREKQLAEMKEMVREAEEWYFNEFGVHPDPRIVKTPEDMARIHNDPEQHREFLKKLEGEKSNAETVTSETEDSEEKKPWWLRW